MSKLLIDLNKLPEFSKRKPYNEDEPSGFYFESDKDYINSNKDLCIALLEIIENFAHSRK